MPDPVKRSSGANDTADSRQGNDRNQDGEGRREILKRFGRYGLYTAPALLALFKTEKASGYGLPP
jgi:hypothetical protein